MTTRNITDNNSLIIGTLTLPDSTTEDEWTRVLNLYKIVGPLDPVKTSSLNSTTLSSSGQVTTSSSSPSLVGGMTCTPIAGTYLAFFSGGIYTGGASAAGEFGFYLNSILLAETRRDISCNLVLLGGLVTVSLNNIGVGTYTGTEFTTDGTLPIEVKFKSTNGGTIGFNERVMTLLKVR